MRDGIAQCKTEKNVRPDGGSNPSLQTIKPVMYLQAIMSINKTGQIALAYPVQNSFNEKT